MGLFAPAALAPHKPPETASFLAAPDKDPGDTLKTQC